MTEIHYIYSLSEIPSPSEISQYPYQTYVDYHPGEKLVLLLIPSKRARETIETLITKGYRILDPESLIATLVFERSAVILYLSDKANIEWDRENLRQTSRWHRNDPPILELVEPELPAKPRCWDLFLDEE